MNNHGVIVSLCKKHFPQLQAIYFFGSYTTEHQTSASDVDLALLLPVEVAKMAGSLSMHELRFELEDTFNKDVDLVNLREVSTVFQKEILSAEGCIYNGDVNGIAEFEMLTISYYQKLCSERADIVQSIIDSGRVL